MIYKQLIQEAVAKAKASGQPITKVFIKDEFLKQFPQAANDPRFTTLLPETFRMNFAIHETLTAGELRELCATKPDHPLSILKRSHLLGLSDTQIITVLRDELDILRQGETPTTVAPLSPPTPPIETPPIPTQESSKRKKNRTVPAEGIVESIVDDTN